MKMLKSGLSILFNHLTKFIALKNLSMPVEIVTKDDLQVLRFQLINDIKELIILSKNPKEENLQGYKTSQVRKLLGCSTNKVYALRTAGKLRFKKVGGTVYYKKDDIKRLMDEGF